MTEAEGSPAARITLIGRSGCHLCDVARDVIELVCVDTGDAWVEMSIEDDRTLYEAYWEKVPVILVDDAPHAFWRVSPDRLRAALADGAAGG